MLASWDSPEKKKKNIIDFSTINNGQRLTNIWVCLKIVYP